MSAPDPSASVNLNVLGNLAGAQSIQNNPSINNATSATLSGTFNGSLADLKTKYPQIYNQVVLQSIAYQIVTECNEQNEEYLDQIKQDEDS